MLSSNVISLRQKCFLPQCNFFAAKIVFFLQRAKCFRAFLFFFWKKNPHPAFVLTGWESRERNREDGSNKAASTVAFLCGRSLAAATVVFRWL